VVTIAPARPEDAEAIAGLLDEMDRFYGGTPDEPLDEQLAQIHEALFDELPAARVVLAWKGTDLVGFASYSFLWPAAGLTRSLYLKELYVAESDRRSGIGKLLMAALFDEADKRRCSRVEWTTDTSNAKAQRFYDELGVMPNAFKIFYRYEVA
jgi:GNAT superfamily N-acetyltransferase